MEKIKIHCASDEDVEASLRAHFRLLGASVKPHVDVSRVPYPPETVLSPYLVFVRAHARVAIACAALVLVIGGLGAGSLFLGDRIGSFAHSGAPFRNAETMTLAKEQEIDNEVSDAAPESGVADDQVGDNDVFHELSAN